MRSPRRRRLSQQALTANAIAVLPVRYFGSDTALRPLERGVTHLMITDLSKVGRLRLLERERVQALVDEMKLSDEGRTGSGDRRTLRTAAPGGKRGSGLAAGGPRQRSAQARRRRGEHGDRGSAGHWFGLRTGLQQLFDMEKQVVMQLAAAAEHHPFSRRAARSSASARQPIFRPSSPSAEGSTRKTVVTTKRAEAAYNEAAARDPNFRAAKERRDEMVRLSSAASLPPQQFAGLERARTWRGAGSSGLGREATTLETAVTITVPSTGGGLINRIGPDLDASPSESTVLARGNAEPMPGRWPLRNHHHHRHPAVRAPLRRRDCSLPCSSAPPQGPVRLRACSVRRASEEEPRVGDTSSKKATSFTPIRQFAYPVAVLIPSGSDSRWTSGPLTPRRR